MLACVVHGKGEGLDCGSVFLVPITDLIREKYDSTTLKLGCSATDITHISFPTPDEVYLVIQPQITARSRENEITIIHLSLKTRPRQMQTVLIKSQVSCLITLDFRTHTHTFSSFYRESTQATQQASSQHSQPSANNPPYAHS